MNSTFTDLQRSRAVAVSLHGDEGTGKRSRSLLVLNWSPVALQGTDHKFPICVALLETFSSEALK